MWSLHYTLPHEFSILKTNYRCGGFSYFCIWKISIFSKFSFVMENYSCKLYNITKTLKTFSLVTDGIRVVFLVLIAWWSWISTVKMSHRLVTDLYCDTMESLCVTIWCPLYKCPLYGDWIMSLYWEKFRLSVLRRWSALWYVRFIEIPLYAQISWMDSDFSLDVFATANHMSCKKLPRATFYGSWNTT